MNAIRGDLMQKMLDAIEQINKLKDTRGMLKKQEIIADNKDNEMFIKLLFYTLNPLLTYNISKEIAKKLVVSPVIERKVDAFDDIFELCDHLSKLKSVNSALIELIHSFLFKKCTEEERVIYIKILSKSLKLGITAKTVNKVIPGLIPEWEVQQAYPIEKYPIKDGTWFTLTQKLNGVRATYYKGQLIARSGVPFEGLNHITDILDNIEDDMVYDGELILRDKGNLSDNEAFRIATGIINSDGDKSAISFIIFDAVKTEEFDSKRGFPLYVLRRKYLNSISKLPCFGKEVNILPALYYGHETRMIDYYLNKMVEEDKEGLMANLDVEYKCCRHKGILKVKRFYTMDLPIVGYEEGGGRLSGTLGALVLDYKGNEVKVGSGFSDEQRKLYWQKRDEIIGTLCEVKYKEVSTDKRTNAESLQFPVFVALRTDKNEINYE